MVVVAPDNINRVFICVEFVFFDKAVLGITIVSSDPGYYKVDCGMCWLDNWL